MSEITIKQVKTRADLRDFIEVHYDLYEGDPYDAPNLYDDELSTLSPKKNAAFEFCEAAYFIAYDGDRRVGRVAAIINHKANERWGQERVRFGWIDFVDDPRVSAALLGAVEKYGRDRGMKEIVGPLGFTDLDPEGMLIEGFDQLGTMATIYNYPYYPKHIEALPGYTVEATYVEHKLMVPTTVPDKYARVAAMITKRYGLKVRKITRDEVKHTNIGEQIFHLINDTYKDLYGYSELSERQVKQYVGMYLPMADLNLITLIEDSNLGNKLVGVGITIPSLTRALQKCRRGSMWPFGWWHLLRAIKFHKTKVVDLLLVGVLPEYRAKGANSLLFADLIPRYIDYGFEWGESHVALSTNHNSLSQWEALNPIVHKRRYCYLKNIEKGK